MYVQKSLLVIFHYVTLVTRFYRLYHFFSIDMLNCIIFARMVKCRSKGIRIKSSSKQIEKYNNTGKSLSEALIFASTNPQYDDRLFIELQVHYMKIPRSNLGRTCCVQKLFLTFRTIFVHNMFSPRYCKKKSF